MTFTGSTRQILKYNLLYVILVGLTASVGLLGGNWPYLFTTTLIIGLPLVLMLSAVQARMNRFTFDDTNLAIIKPGGRRIPYARIREIVLIERRARIDVFARQGRMNLTSLVEAADAGQGQQLVEGLSRRFPDRVRRRPAWTTFVPILVLLALLVTALLGAHLFLYIRYPSLTAPTRMLALTPPPRAKAYARQFLDEFAFSLPKGFRYAGEGEHTLYFENRQDRARIKVVANVPRPDIRKYDLLFRYGMGVRDMSDLLYLAHRSRIGLIPLLLRGLDLTGLKRVAVYTVGPPLRGIVKQGMQGKEAVTQIDLTGGGGEEIQFFLSGPRLLDEGEIAEIVAGIRIVQPAGMARQ